MSATPRLSTQALDVEHQGFPTFMQPPAGESSKKLVLYNENPGKENSPAHKTAAKPAYAIVTPDQYTIAIVCALPREYDAVVLLFDDGLSCTYHAPNDHNIYTLGQFANHHTVLVMPGDSGELDAGLCTQRLRNHFRNIELTLLVGICGAMSQNFETEEAIYLGDVIIGKQVWRYLHNARYGQLEGTAARHELRNPMMESNSERVRQLGRLSGTKTQQNGISAYSSAYLASLQNGSGSQYNYPGYSKDELAKHDCIHKHRSENLRCSCSDPLRDSCAAAKRTSCKELGCEIVRVRPIAEEPPKPNIHLGTIASADIVMRASEAFRENFESNFVAGIDMEGGGVNRVTDCIVIKGAVDYADSHKNKAFQFYACATAASVAKAFLMVLYHGGA
ncbi:hypothetical protein FALCPG4_010047 [Fusarium falciforme]